MRNIILSLSAVFLTVFFISCSTPQITPEISNQIRDSISFEDQDQGENMIGGDIMISLPKGIKLSKFGVKNIEVYLADDKDSTENGSELATVKTKSLEKKLTSSDRNAVLTNLKDGTEYSAGQKLVFVLTGGKDVKHFIAKDVVDAFEPPQDESDSMSANSTNSTMGTDANGLPIQPNQPVQSTMATSIRLNNVMFDYDKALLKYADQTYLDQEFLNFTSLENIKVNISGHCDERGTSEYNLRLGEKRAMAVRDYLIIIGVPERNISYISYGEEHPLNQGHNASAWTENRRAEIEILTQ